MNCSVWLFYCLIGVLITGNSLIAYENIALGKSAWQRYPYSTTKWGADKAVDGLYSKRTAADGQCTISDNNRRTATWRVYLGDILSIHHITVYVRTDDVSWGATNGYTSRVLGFSLYISNTTNKDDGTLCFKDDIYTKATVPNTTSIICIQHGRYVIYYNERLPGVPYPVEYSPYAFNELCELEVYGCPTSGLYGINCDIPCPQNCQERHCNIMDGTCLGCVAGYRGPRCDRYCDDDRYGLECSMTCGNCSNGEQCNHVNGSCPNRCGFGAQGDKCDEACPYGRYGKNCVDVCNLNCRGGCNRFTGVCELGCYPGWKGDFCENECDGLHYGADCNISCGSCLSFEQCHHINGTCLNGCDRGFQGETCSEGCIDGRYGYNCQDTCNINCGVPGRCNRVTGQCQGGCQEGWKHMRCIRKCDGGKYGLNCAQSCGVCFDKEQCHHINGSCLNGCDRGYEGIKCTQECDSGFHGYGCNETCSTTCFNKTCNAMSGACPLVAVPDSQEINTVPIIGGAVGVFGLTLVVVTLVLVFRRKNTSGSGKEQNDKEKRAEQLSSENTIPYMDIYDKISENGPYQELGPKTEVSDNGGYQELGHRTGKSENGEYQELGPRTEVPDDGGYRGLGPRIHIEDQSKDNKDYQELGQISQHSHYDSLH